MSKINDNGVERDMTDAEQAEYDAYVTEMTLLRAAQAISDVEGARRAAYETQSDPLFFEWQRGDGTEQAWLDAVAAVKAAHPYPPAP
jgi:hypothetical protein